MHANKLYPHHGPSNKKERCGYACDQATPTWGTDTAAAGLSEATHVHHGSSKKKERRTWTSTSYTHLGH